MCLESFSCRGYLPTKHNGNDPHFFFVITPRGLSLVFFALLLLLLLLLLLTHRYYSLDELNKGKPMANVNDV